MLLFQRAFRRQAFPARLWTRRRRGLPPSSRRSPQDEAGSRSVQSPIRNPKSAIASPPHPAFPPACPGVVEDEAGQPARRPVRHSRRRSRKPSPLGIAFCRLRFAVPFPPFASLAPFAANPRPDKALRPSTLLRAARAGSRGRVAAAVSLSDARFSSRKRLTCVRGKLCT